MQTNIIVTLQVEGLHCWPDAKIFLPQVSYLSDLHRHIFYITLKKRVFHDDRDVEFINFKHLVLDYLKEKYFDEYTKCHLFEHLSCEMLANELLNEFNCLYCSVMEDNENGAEIIK